MRTFNVLTGVVWLIGGVLILADHPDARGPQRGDAPRRQGVPRHVEQFEVLQVGAVRQEAGALVEIRLVSAAVLLDRSQQLGLLFSPLGSFPVEKHRVNAAVEFVDVHGIEPVLEAGYANRRGLEYPAGGWRLRLPDGDTRIVPSGEEP